MPNPLTPSLDLSALHPQQARQLATARRETASSHQEESAPVPEAANWKVEALRLRTALEDVVALAHASADATQRVIQMQRRAIAALSGLDSRR